MARFPDTVFKLAGLLKISQSEGGVAIPVFESLENEEIFFTQRVKLGGIAAFERLTMEFERMELPQRLLRKPGDHAIHAFLIAGVALVGERSELREPLERLLGSNDIEREEAIEAALLLEDWPRLRQMLDGRFFEMCNRHPASAEFFRLNNILRFLVAHSLASPRLEEILKNTRISSGGGHKLSLSFPSGACRGEVEAISNEIRAQADLSAAFAGLTHLFVETRGEPRAMELTDYAQYLQLDLDLSAASLRRHEEREIFIPHIIGVPEFTTKDGKRLDFKALWVRAFTLDLDPDSDWAISRENLLLLRAINLEDARALTALLLKAACELDVERWWELGGIRCCLFSIRSSALAEEPVKFETENGTLVQPNDLFCINAIRRFYDGSQFQMKAPLYTFVTVPEKGAVSEENFSALDFGVEEEYLAFTIHAMLGL